MPLRVGYHNNWKRKEKETRILLEVTIFCFINPSRPAIINCVYNLDLLAQSKRRRYDDADFYSVNSQVVFLYVLYFEAYVCYYSIVDGTLAILFLHKKTSQFLLLW